MNSFVADVLIAFGSLFSIVDPFAAVPVFVGLTATQSEKEKHRIAVHAALTCFAILSVFGIAGATIFKFFGITIPAFKIAGGVLLFGVGLEMMRAQQTASRTTSEEVAEPSSDIGVIPLGLPLLSGPGAIAAVMLLSGRAATLQARLSVEVAVLLVGVSAWLILRSGTVIAKLLGKTGLNMIGRLMGLVLAAIAVQFVIDGAHEAFPKTFL
jgi:multiple antibiotic resistance protein